MVYYGLSLGVSDLGGDIYLNTVISGLVEFPGFFLCIVTMNRIGRRWPLGVMMIASGVLLVLVIPVPKGEMQLDRTSYQLCILAI